MPPMKLLPPFIALLIALPASAKDNAKSETQASPSNPNKEQKTQVLAAPDKDASFHSDEIAGKIYRTDGKRLLLEMRGLVVHKLMHGSVAIEEREVGETRRIFV